MDWYSQSNARIKFKIDQVKHKSSLKIFIEYAWNNSDSKSSDCEDIQLINWINSMNIDFNNENWFHSSKLDARVASRINFTVNVKSNENLRMAHETNNAIKCAQFAYKLRKILPILIDCHDDINYTNDDGQTILHIFLEKYLKATENSTSESTQVSAEVLIRLRELMENLVERGTSFYVYDKNQKTPLHIALKSKNIELLRIIVSSLTNVNGRDAYGNTVLHFIIDSCEDEIRYIDILQILMLKGADINGKNNKGLTAVHLAAEKFHVKMLKFFAHSGADFSQCLTNDNETLLHLACKFSSKMRHTSKVIETIIFLISQGCNTEAVDQKGYMPLHYAAEYGSSHLIELLIELGADVDCRNEITWITPLFLASKADRLNNIRILVQAGADVNTEAADGSTPIFIVAMLGSIKCFRFLLEHGADLYRRDQIRGLTLLHMTAYVVDLEPIDTNNSGMGLEMATDIQATNKREKNRKNFDVVIDKDFNVNDPGKCGVTPLHLATLTKNLDIVKMLIERGANVNFQSDLDELTALHIATIFDNLKIVKLLIKAGANVNCRGGINQMTPLHLNMMTFIDWNLGKYPSDIAKSDRERSILSKFWPDWKCRESDKSQPKNVLLTLIENGADVNAKDACRRTPLHLATLQWGIGAIEILLKSNAQVNVQDAEGRLPLHNILEDGSVRKLKLLLDHGADINDIDTIKLIVNGKGDLRRLVIEQAIKLKLIGLPIAKIYEQYIGAREFINFYNSCLAEAKTLINYQEDGFSFYQFLHMNVKRQYYFNQQVSSSFDTLNELFPIYSSVIIAACREAAYRKPLLESARIAWTEISTIYLPDVCVEHIFSHLNNRYLEVFVSAANSDVKIVCKRADDLLRGSNKRCYKYGSYPFCVLRKLF